MTLTTTELRDSAEFDAALAPLPTLDDEVTEARRRVERATRELHRLLEFPKQFVPGQTPLLPAGAVLAEEDRVALVAAALDLRIVSGPIAKDFERAYARMLGVRKSLLVNSGSSANLVAMTSLTSPRLRERRLQPGDEVITAAAGFPTTVNPILQNGLVPVFVDVELGTYNATPEAVEAAIGPRTKAIALAHTLGNPFDAHRISEIAREHGLWLIEDNCDALGSRLRGSLTGTFGDLSTSSFYPAHHITTGEGGCVASKSLMLAKIAESVRDWGRACWCEPGVDNTCHRRFDWQLGTLPAGYDHKYTYTHIGYNLKSTDLQAALGLTQLPKLDRFGEARRRNWRLLREGLADVPGLILPRATEGADPSWFGFPLTVSDDARFTRRELVAFLEDRKIGTRQIFAGNLTRHPAYQDAHYRVSGELTTSDIITERSLWIGVHPRLTTEMVDYMARSIRDFATGAKVS
ncbi:lipopolysaccharide biosynthesis protein RfbH [Actinospica robiniae]|uniref:lipopolysaccharide biosynthesis protein RfbH n=1 Tax=Actinospica robiniae TaxID=304901 RepID=UPI00041C1811|nr:lipopolysaccharide biosynthesis protein RfbH [Actinospica robiniae]